MDVVDSHHHLWRRADIVPVGILAAPYLTRDFPWEDLEEAAAGLDLAATAFVQVRDDLEEVRYVEEVAAAGARLGAMIAWAPLERPELAAALTRLQAHPLVRGVRRSTQHEVDPAFVARPDYVAGVRLLGETGLLCEVCVRHRQLAAVPRLARACPETTVVLEHLGKPDVTGEPPPEWLRDMEELGSLSNVLCKVSPVVHSDADPPFTAEGQAPFIRHVVRCFGWERVLFGSNWPVSTAVVSYGGWVDIVRAALPDATPEQLEALFSGNARRLYGLP
jgi:L-fuconolactonase